MSKEQQNSSDGREKKPRRFVKPAKGVAASREKAARLNQAAEALPEEVRLNRYIASAGLASRRKADELVQQGRVKLNGEVVTDLASRVRKGDRVEVNGRIISPQGLTYILLNKPPDTITTKSDEKGRMTVLDLLDVPEPEKSGLFPVGRLDRHTVGALLLTNDGDLAHRLMHPRYNIQKIYVARTARPIKPHEIEALLEGVQLDDGPARVDRVTYTAPPNFSEIAIQLHEGRNRQIRRMMEALGHEVTYLERVNYAGLTPEGIRRGRWRRLSPFEVKRLRHLVKLPS